MHRGKGQLSLLLGPGHPTHGIVYFLKSTSVVRMRTSLADLPSCRVRSVAAWFGTSSVRFYNSRRGNSGAFTTARWNHSKQLAASVRRRCRSARYEKVEESGSQSPTFTPYSRSEVPESATWVQRRQGSYKRSHVQPLGGPHSSGNTRRAAAAIRHKTAAVIRCSRKTPMGKKQVGAPTAPHNVYLPSWATCNNNHTGRRADFCQAIILVRCGQDWTDTRERREGRPILTCI